MCSTHAGSNSSTQGCLTCLCSFRRHAFPTSCWEYAASGSVGGTQCLLSYVRFDLHAAMNVFSSNFNCNCQIMRPRAIVLIFALIAYTGCIVAHLADRPCHECSSFSKVVVAWIPTPLTGAPCGRYWCCRDLCRSHGTTFAISCMSCNFVCSKDLGDQRCQTFCCEGSDWRSQEDRQIVPSIWHWLVPGSWPVNFQWNGVPWVAWSGMNHGSNGFRSGYFCILYI